MPLISVCQILMQEDNKVRGNLGYTVRHCLKVRIKGKRKKGREGEGVVRKEGGGWGGKERGGREEERPRVVPSEIMVPIVFLQI